jgi:hypothetical protein
MHTRFPQWVYDGGERCAQSILAASRKADMILQSNGGGLGLPGGFVGSCALPVPAK